MTSSTLPTTRYLWATGEVAATIPVGTLVGDRYQVTAPHIWQDIAPNTPPPSPDSLPDAVLPYARLYNYRLHIPEVYSIHAHPHGTEEAEILLLDNSPIMPNGQLQPAILDRWGVVSPVRQVYWLWQILDLWTPLATQGVAASLLQPENLRVEGWRIRLRELLSAVTTPAENVQPGTLQHLGYLWSGWCTTAHDSIRSRLTKICCDLQQVDVSLEDVRLCLNKLLLEEAAQLPLSVELAGLSDAGPQRDHNEDSCYPTLQDIQTNGNDPLLRHLAVVCDGVGGHDGGEVASQQAVQTIKLLMQALLSEMTKQAEIQAPEVFYRRLDACVRIVNNQIAAQNDQQGRELRQRMGTTLVMAVQPPPMLPSADGQLLNTHELYLCNVGDSRAYWLTLDYCHQLTIDDDIAARDVRVGYSLRHESLRRSDGGILTQAVGTREANSLRPTIQRHIVEEDGILLLCSDGLSDNNWIETCWQDYAAPILKGTMPLETAVKSLIDLANQRNGHDNVSVILMVFRLHPSRRELQLFCPEQAQQPIPTVLLTEASQALLDDDFSISTASQKQPKSVYRQRLAVLVGIIAFLAGFGLTGLWIWSQLDSSGFQQWREQVLPTTR